MPRTTISLSEGRYRALKETAARRGLTITEIVDQALELAGVNTRESVMEMLREAGRRSGLSADEAMELALRETRAYREERLAERSAGGTAQPQTPRS